MSAENLSPPDGSPAGVVADVLRAVAAVKVADAFAPVVVVTSLGARRLRLELGRSAASVNVQVVYPDQVTGPFAPGVAVIVVGPVPANVTDATTVVHVPTPTGLDLAAVSVLSCPDAAVEGRVAVDALLTARRDGVAWSSMAVAVAASSSEPMLLSALAQASIPCFRSGGRVLSQSASGRFVLAAMDGTAAGWDRRSVSALWGSVPIVDPATGAAVPVRSWERVSRRYQVVGGSDWSQTAARAERAGSTADIAIAHALTGFVSDLVATVDRADAAGLASAMTRFLPAPGSLLARSVFGDNADGEGEAADAVRRILVDVAGDPGFAEATRTRDILARVLAARSMPGSGRVGEGVQVGRPEALALGVFERVVVVGLTDEAERRDPVASGIRAAALALLLRAPVVTVTVARASARSQREVSPYPDLLTALSTRAGAPVTAEDVHTYPSTVPGVGAIPSWSAAVVGPHGTAPLDATDERLAVLHDWVAAGGDLLAHPSLPPDAPLRTSIAADRARHAPDWTTWDGRITELAGWSPTQQAWSVTRLEHFHQCRLRTFLTDVLGARPLECPEDFADPQGRSIGSFVHKVMEHLTNDLLAIEPDARPPWSEWLNGVDHARLEHVMHRAVDDLRADGTIGTGAWWDAQIRWVQARLAHYLAAQARRGDGFEPIAVEHGPTDENAWVLPTPAGEIAMRGRADRLEARGATLRVVDFKTGRVNTLQTVADSEDPLDGGRKLQLPIYAAMAAEHFGYSLADAQGAYVNPLSADTRKRVVTMDVAGLVDPATTALTDAFVRMADGEFTYETATEAGQDKTCLFCDVKTACPVDRITMGRAKTSAAAPVPDDAMASGASLADPTSSDGAATR